MAANFPPLTESQQMACLAVLNISSRKKLSLYLNIESQGAEAKDYKGLAEKIGFEFIEILNFARSPDPMAECLNEWINKHEFEPTVGKLIQYLEELDRNDVITECLPFIIQDINNHHLRRQLKSSPIQDQTVSQSTTPGFGAEYQTVDGNEVLTIEDAELMCPQYYDAFICYNPEGDDIKFVKQLISYAENPPYNLRLFVPGRNDLPGVSAHTISACLIEHRCRKMVIIMSNKFLTSPACDFQTKFAFCLSPGAKLKKLIPVLIESCTIPNIIRHISICDYTRKDLQDWFWDRLIKSLKAPVCFTESDRAAVQISNVKFTISSDYKKIIDSSDSSSSMSSQSSSSASSSRNISSMSSQSSSSSSSRSPASTSSSTRRGQDPSMSTC